MKETLVVQMQERKLLNAMDSRKIDPIISMIMQASSQLKVPGCTEGSRGCTRGCQPRQCKGSKRSTCSRQSRQFAAGWWHPSGYHHHWIRNRQWLLHRRSWHQLWSLTSVCWTPSSAAAGVVVLASSFLASDIVVTNSIFAIAAWC